VHFLYFLQKIIADACFAPELRVHQLGQGLDFPSGDRNSSFAGQGLSAETAPQTVVLKVREKALIVREQSLKYSMRGNWTCVTTKALDSSASKMKADGCGLAASLSGPGRLVLTSLLIIQRRKVSPDGRRD
jgi:hypothetical protein